jgi:hypothetical protein
MQSCGKEVVCLKAIRKRCFIFETFTCFFILMGVILFVFGEAASEIRSQILLVSVVIAGGTAACFWIRELGKLKIASLIAENHIRTAVISDLSGEVAQPEEPESTEVFISYFGILLDAQIIKFNQDGIRLKAVEIGGDFISFTYGMEKRTRNIRLLRPAIDSAAMEEICERFRYEIGITPVLLP